MEAAECSQCGQTVLIWNDRLTEHDIHPKQTTVQCPGSGWLIATHDWYRQQARPA